MAFVDEFGVMRSAYPADSWGNSLTRKLATPRGVGLTPLGTPPPPEERLARSLLSQCARSLAIQKKKKKKNYRHGRIVPAQRERDRVEVNRVIGPAQLAHAVSPGGGTYACSPPANAPV